MPFKRGFEPIRSSLEYLSKCPIKFIDNVKILTVNYNVPQSHITVRGRKFELHEGVIFFVNSVLLYLINYFNFLLPIYFRSQRFCHMDFATSTIS